MLQNEQSPEKASSTVALNTNWISSVYGTQAFVAVAAW